MEIGINKVSEDHVIGKEEAVDPFQINDALLFDHL